MAASNPSAEAGMRRAARCAFAVIAVAVVAPLLPWLAYAVGRCEEDR